MAPRILPTSSGDRLVGWEHDQHRTRPWSNRSKEENNNLIKDRFQEEKTGFMTRDRWCYFPYRRTVRCSLLGKAQQKTKHMVNMAAGLSAPRRARMQETCKSPFSLRPQLCGKKFQKTGNGTVIFPPTSPQTLRHQLCVEMGIQKRGLNSALWNR